MNMDQMRIKDQARRRNISTNAQMVSIRQKRRQARKIMCLASRIVWYRYNGGGWSEKQIQNQLLTQLQFAPALSILSRGRPCGFSRSAATGQNQSTSLLPTVPLLWPFRVSSLLVDCARSDHPPHHLRALPHQPTPLHVSESNYWRAARRALIFLWMNSPQRPTATMKTMQNTRTTPGSL